MYASAASGPLGSLKAARPSGRLFSSQPASLGAEARQVARPPKAAFVTGLRPGQLPSQTARQPLKLTNYSSGGTFLHW